VLLHHLANVLGYYANRKIAENPSVLLCLLACEKCCEVIYFAPKAWFCVYNEPDRAEFQLHDVQNLCWTVQRLSNRTVSHRAGVGNQFA